MLYGSQDTAHTGCLCSFHVFRIAREFKSNAWIVPLSPPASINLPSLRITPDLATSGDVMREIVFRGLRVRVEIIWIREPEVTAKVSAGFVREFCGRVGYVMLVIGEECCDGSRRRGEVKVNQYFCSGVSALGPFGCFVG